MKKHSNKNYNKNLKELARFKRKTGTKAEVVIWKELLSSKKLGVKFLRQRSIDNYIVDFFCKELNLVIEIDGYSHLLDEIKVKDNNRESNLINLGFTVIRFTDNDVLNNIENVKRKVEYVILTLKSHLPNPPQGGN